MARTETQPKANWSCDRCHQTTSTNIATLLPADWRHWTVVNDSSVQVRAWHMCPRCSATMWATTEMPR